MDVILLLHLVDLLLNLRELPLILFLLEWVERFPAQGLIRSKLILLLPRLRTRGADMP